MPLESESWYQPSRGEEVLWYSHPSFIMRLPQILAGILLAIIAAGGSAYVYFMQDWPIEVIYVLLLFVPFGILFSGYRMLVYKNTWYVITNRRVIKKSQILGQDKSSKPHREIVRVDVNVNTMDWFLSRITAEDIGDITIRTADDTGDTFLLSKLPEVGLAESYLERLTGTGPDTPAEYDAEKHDRLKHEQMPDDESPHSPQHQDDPARSTPQNPSAHDPVDQPSNQTARNDPAKQQSDAPYPNAPPRDDDEFDDFEPSDHA